MKGSNERMIFKVREFASKKKKTVKKMEVKLN